MKPFIRNYYKIIKLEDPNIKDRPYAKIALFEEDNHMGSILDAIHKPKIIRFIHGQPPF